MANPVGLWNLRQRFESVWDYYGMTKDNIKNKEEDENNEYNKMNLTSEEIEKIRDGEFIPRKVDSMEDMWDDIKS